MVNHTHNSKARSEEWEKESVTQEVIFSVLQSQSRALNTAKWVSPVKSGES